MGPETQEVLASEEDQEDVEDEEEEKGDAALGDTLETEKVQPAPGALDVEPTPVTPTPAATPPSQPAERAAQD